MSQETWHTVKQGEWLSKIAAKYGLPDWNIIWKDPHNADLAKRRNPNVLFPGDQLFIPEPAVREESGATNTRNQYVAKTFSDYFELTLLYPDGTPVKNKKYTLHITDPPLTGTTDANGHFKHDNLNPDELHSGVLQFPDTNLSIWIGLGNLNPAAKGSGNEISKYNDGLSGIQMRLSNLGYDPGSTDGEYDDSGAIPSVTRQAIAMFQLKEMNLPPEKATGELDDDTRNAIIGKHRN
jgi:hypothetical protein